MGLLDFIFPKYCVNCKKIGSYICSDCFSFISFDVSMICFICNKNTFDGMTHPVCIGRYSIDGSFAAISYRGIVKKLIYNFKYKPYLSDLKNVLVELFYESIIQNEIFVKTMEQFGNGERVLVPIPLHKDKLKKRGYNHAEILAKGLAGKLGLKVLNALERIKPTKSQFGLKLKDRKDNIANVFVVNTKYLLPDSVFLIDDVLTTGSTLLEAAKTLKKNGVGKVFGLTLARD